MGCAGAPAALQRGILREELVREDQPPSDGTAKADRQQNADWAQTK